MVISKVYQISDDEFIELVNNCESVTDCLSYLGYVPSQKRGRINGKAFSIFKRRCEELGIDRNRFLDNRTKKAHDVTRQPIEEILVENSKYVNISRLKKRLVSEGLLEYKCARCGNAGIWQDEPLQLELDHINSNHFDNRLTNLQFLCPNCHAQKHAEERQEQK